jgi:hypothetical protein
MKIHSISEDPTQAGRYLAGKLSEAECVEYEARFLQDPEAVAELEATARLKIGLHRLRESGELDELIAGSGASSPHRTFFLALAASVAAIVISLGVWYPRTGNPTAPPVLASAASMFKDRSGHSLSVLSTTPLYRTRAESYDAVIELPPNRGAIRLRVLPSTPVDAAHYQATLSRVQDDDSSQRIISIADLRPATDDGFVDLFADSSLLAPGRYRLILTREGTGSAASESDSFVIKVTAAAH